MSADLEAQARRLREREEGRAQEDELLQAARREQVRQLEALSRERRERARAVEERARLARLEQVRLMAAQEEAHRDRARAKQREALAEMDAQLEARAREDEQWLHGQLEAERLQQVEFETALRLQHAAQAHAEEGQAALLQSEVDARRRLLDVKQQTAAQRWAAEDAQKRTGRALEELEQRREAEAEEEHGAIVAAQARARLEEEAAREQLAVVEAQRQARAFAEAQHAQALVRHGEARREADVLAREELRLMAAAARCGLPHAPCFSWCPGASPCGTNVSGFTNPLPPLPARRDEVLLQRQMDEGERIIRAERAKLAEIRARRARQLRALEARQRVEGFEQGLLEQRGAARVAARHHERDVHKVRLCKPRAPRSGFTNYFADCCAYRFTVPPRVPPTHIPYRARCCSTWRRSAAPSLPSTRRSRCASWSWRRRRRRSSCAASHRHSRPPRSTRAPPAARPRPVRPRRQSSARPPRTRATAGARTRSAPSPRRRRRRRGSRAGIRGRRRWQTRASRRRPGGARRR